MRTVGRHQGAHIFVDVLARYAAQTHNTRVAAIEQRMRAPLRVAVTGRSGVGRGEVSAALEHCGFTPAAPPDPTDLHVLVIAESLKPEDREALRSSPAPALVVLNKADLAGADQGGPLDSAQRTADQLATQVSVPVVPMVALLSGLELGDEDVAAVRVLAASPPDMNSVDAFVEAPHRLPSPCRARLLSSMDRFGLAHAIVAVADGADAATLSRQLRKLSQIDRVVEVLADVAAPVRHRRIHEAVRELHIAAAQTGDDRLAEFATSDEVVLAVMAAAVDVVRACGGAVDPGDDTDAHRRRAVHWGRYARGPVSSAHHRCASDIVRGSLRLLDRDR